MEKIQKMGLLTGILIISVKASLPFRKSELLIKRVLNNRNSSLLNQNINFQLIK
jgi:hypothetical protein